MSQKKSDTKSTSIQELNTLLAMYHVAFQNARFCHWNVTGPVFEDNHEVFEEIYDMLYEDIDVFAEQVRQLEDYPMSKFSEYLKKSGLSEYEMPMSAADMQKAMNDDLTKISEQLQSSIDTVEGDQATQDHLIAAKQGIDKKRWFLRAMLGKK